MIPRLCILVSFSILTINKKRTSVGLKLSRNNCEFTILGKHIQFQFLNFSFQNFFVRKKNIYRKYIVCFEWCYLSFCVCFFLFRIQMKKLRHLIFVCFSLGNLVFKNKGGGDFNLISNSLEID